MRKYRSRKQERRNEDRDWFETCSFPNSLAATHHGFTFYVADPISSIPLGTADATAEIFEKKDSV
jgi:hypothetical protein